MIKKDTSQSIPWIAHFFIQSIMTVSFGFHFSFWQQILNSRRIATLSNGLHCNFIGSIEAENRESQLYILLLLLLCTTDAHYLQQMCVGFVCVHLIWKRFVNIKICMALFSFPLASFSFVFSSFWSLSLSLSFVDFRLWFYYFNFNRALPFDWFSIFCTLWCFLYSDILHKIALHLDFIDINILSCIRFAYNYSNVLFTISTFSYLRRKPKQERKWNDSIRLFLFYWKLNRHSTKCH